MKKPFRKGGEKATNSNVLQGVLQKKILAVSRCKKKAQKCEIERQIFEFSVALGKKTANSGRCKKNAQPFFFYSALFLSVFVFTILAENSNLGGLFFYSTLFFENMCSVFFFLQCALCKISDF